MNLGKNRRSAKLPSLHRSKEGWLRHKSNVAKPPLLAQTGWFPLRVSIGKPPRPRGERTLRDIFLIARPPLLAVMQGGDSCTTAIHSQVHRAPLQSFHGYDHVCIPHRRTVALSMLLNIRFSTKRPSRITVSSPAKTFGIRSSFLFSKMYHPRPPEPELTPNTSSAAMSVLHAKAQPTLSPVSMLGKAAGTRIRAM